MAKLTKFLGNVFNGIFQSKGDMADYQHAARLFQDDYMRSTQRSQAYIYVVFNINNASYRNHWTRSKKKNRKESQPNVVC